MVLNKSEYIICLPWKIVCPKLLQLPILDTHFLNPGQVPAPAPKLGYDKKYLVLPVEYNSV